MVPYRLPSPGTMPLTGDTHPTVHRATRLQYALLFSLLLLLGVVLLQPVVLTLRGGFADDIVTREGFTLRHVALVFRDPVTREGLINALIIAAATTVLATLIALPLAFLSARYRYPLKGAWNALVLAPMILPPFVGAIGVRAVLGRSGALNSLLGTEIDILGAHRMWGVIVTLSLNLYPIVYLNAAAALANLNASLDEAARVFGAGAWRRFFSITLPLIRPGLFAGGAIVFIWAFTELGTPLVFDYYAVTSVQIFNGVKKMDASVEPYALTAVMLTLAVMFYVLGKVVLGKAGHATGGRAFVASGERPLGRGAGALASLAFAGVAGLALIPHLGVLFVALSEPGSWYRTVLPKAWTLHNFQEALSHPLASGAIQNSLMLAGAAAALDVVLGVLIGYLIARTTCRGRGLLDALAMLPLAVPGLVMAFGYVAMSLNWPFGKGDPLEGWVDVVGANPNPMPLLVVAYAVRRLPYVVRATVAGLQQIPVDLEEAARVFGSSAAGAVRKTVVPLIAANLLAGGLLAFSFAMLEVSDSLILAQQEQHFPITKAIYSFAERLGDGSGIACGMGVWGMLLLATTLVGVSALLGKRLGAVFRA